ncbi:hypothetical protein [Halogeometricum borinquense]|uniref:hypothetical protein n=1 Tax=Halogeometricum borinquense TaxID=60847 RepID=UPI00195518C0|nr:hypothetical protein [Halogeometricum borinquense]
MEEISEEYEVSEHYSWSGGCITKMYLKNFNREHEFTLFDPSKGEGSEFNELDDEATSGYCIKSDFGWAAIYTDIEDETLLVQINNDTWNLADPDTRVIYRHKSRTDESYFKIEDDTTSFEITYDSWWTDIPQPSSNAVMTVKEMYNDDEEDLFAHIKSVYSVETLRKTV